ncbi:MAG: transposase [Candidatus Marinimicrobia bacterium]|nr:transposase [Candidatus Neomarinimicrobiota bacterium]
MEVAPLIMEKACLMHEELYGSKLDHFLMDAGYDAHFIYEKAALDLKVPAIVKLNLRGQKKPPAGFTEDGTPICPGKHPMVYWGTDKKRLLNKFRCPKAVGKNVICNKECGCKSACGKVTNVSIRKNPRLFSSPHRGSKRWEELYKLRWHIERLLNVLKNKLNLGQVTVRGLSKVILHVNLCMLAYLAGTAAMLACKAKQEAA